MSEPITYVGIDAHKVELHVALWWVFRGKLNTDFGGT